MKFYVYCLIIIANISINGKASLDSFLPSNANILFEDTTKSSDKSCYRPCKFNVKPRRCFYKFKVELNFIEGGKPSITINGISPGPPINVCLNDIVIVEVENKIPGEDLALHWHGLEQKATPFMDGVPMVTQCPITYGSTYKYAFVAASPGTFFYHADLAVQQNDGVYGSLIVNQPQPLEPHSSLYDYDRSQENTLLIGAKFPRLMSGSLEDLSKMRPDALTINGGEDIAKVFVLPNYAYRLRLINGIAIECPVTLQVDQHEMMVIASDGRPVKPVAARKVILYPGERVDVVVRASQETGGYWLQALGTGACAGLNTKAMLLYSGFNYTSMLQDGQIIMHDESETKNAQAISGQYLEAIQDATYTPSVRSIYIGIDRNVVNFTDSDNDFRYISDAHPQKPLFPAALSLQDKGVVQINNKSFLYPSVPILLKRDSRLTPTCTVGEENTIRDIQCVQMLHGTEGETLELALVNEGRDCNDSYTFHMHGYGMQVIATWENPEMKPLTKETYLQLEKDGVIKRNTQNPPIKDTVTVPNKGVTIVRVKLDFGGSWLLECRACSLSSLPTALVINVPRSVPIAVLDSLPKCGNYKPPDVLLA